MSKTQDSRDEFAKAQVKRPKYVKACHLEYLDDLRESGATNMWAAGSWVKRAYPRLSEAQCDGVLSYWMKTFSQRHAK